MTFDDVAGLDGVKADLMEIVDFLKSPEKFQKLGGRVPRGSLLNALLVLARRCLRGRLQGKQVLLSFRQWQRVHSNVCRGGASRVRDLFQTAKPKVPPFIFIDEIDAVGRQRGAGLGGGHDEREQTLNQILSEMDGFSQSDSVIVMAATNRPDVLDPAFIAAR